MIAVDNTRNCTIFSLFLFYLTGTVCTLHKNIKNSRISVKLQGYWTKGEVGCFFDLNIPKEFRGHLIFEQDNLTFLSRLYVIRILFDLVFLRITI